MKIKTNMIVKNLVKNNKGLYEVSIDDEVHTLDEETILKYRLLKNKEVSIDIIEEILNEDKINRLANKILEYKIKYLKSINECKRHFNNKDISISDIDKAIEILISKKLIDELKLASNIASSLARNSNGYYLIKEKLTQKLFDSYIIEQAIESINEEDILLGKEKLLKKLDKKYSNESDNIKKLKIKKQLYQHGYRWDE